MLLLVMMVVVVVLMTLPPPAIGTIVDIGGITEIIHSIGDISISRRRSSRFDHFVVPTVTANVAGNMFS